MFRFVRLISVVSIVLFTINYVFFVWVWREPFIFIFDEGHFNDTLAKISIPRWPGSLGHAKVSDFLVEELQQMGFVAHRDEVFDGIRLYNILGIMNTEASNFLMLTCHYDSKFLKDIPPTSYVAATDGAVSCAILLNMAKTLSSYLRGHFSQREDIGLVLVFFDGHESFNNVEEDFNSMNGSRRFVQVETIPLKNIELVITLNLIGAPDHIYLSHFENTFLMHQRMEAIEMELRKASKLAKCHKLIYSLKDHDTDIEDDHYPFLDEGVPVMHIVPHTYPEVWHTVADNLTNLHWPSILNMKAIITHFVYEYLAKHKAKYD